MIVRRIIVVLIALLIDVQVVRNAAVLGFAETKPATA
ncbi:MAG: hypothetical protein QOK41_1835, partial [Sphingomonadales bacterium]|nr:hypothetical protein [Sphingomonadales bacterium]